MVVAEGDRVRRSSFFCVNLQATLISESVDSMNPSTFVGAGPDSKG